MEGDGEGDGDVDGREGSEGVRLGTLRDAWRQSC